jgi:hypothetical protein
VIANPVLLLVGIGQITAGFYSLLTGAWKIGAINALVGVANVIFSTVKA